MIRRRNAALAALVGLAVLATALLAGCSSPPAVDVTVTDPGRTRLDVTIGEGYRFDPPSLTVQAGKPVAIVVHNKQAMVHDWTVQKIAVRDLKITSSYRPEPAGNGPGLHLAVPPGGVGKLEFTPIEKGSLAFFCSVPGHRESGMVGTLTVQ